MNLRLALFTMHSPMAEEAALRFCEAHRDSLAFIGISDPRRPSMGGFRGQLRRHMARSGPRLLPYLLLGFALPEMIARAFGTKLRRLGIPVRRVQDVNGAEMRAALEEARIDLIVSLHYDQIFGPGTLALSRLGGINLHPSLLPKHRGPMPVFWALAEGRGKTGVTIHRLTQEIDGGEILAQRPVTLPKTASVLEASRLLHLAGVAPLSAVVQALAAGEALPAHPPGDQPYRSFPTAAALREARTRLVRWADLRRLIPCG